MNCSKMLSNDICGTNKSTATKMGFFTKIVFLILSGFLSLNTAWEGGHHL